MDFKDIIKTNRSKLGLTLDDIARYVGVSGATVSRWESGDIENIRRDKIAKLAEILRVTPSYLMGWETDFVEGRKISPEILTEISCSLYELNAVGREKVSDYAKDLTKIPKYQAKISAENE